MNPLSEENWEVDETEESEQREQDVIKFQITYYPADFTLRGYFDKIENGQLEIPPFQRNYVWDRVQASKLIESFLLGLPVPGVFLYKERKTNKLRVIDGQQRIISVVRFFKNEFENQLFRLKNINAKWEGKTFEELSEPDRFQLDDTVLRATVVQQIDPGDDSSIYHIFERLNTGGMKLNPMEIRKCVYFSDLFMTLQEMNKFEQWRKILGKPHEDKRFRDVELILRILALKDEWELYEKPMKQFLNNFMSTNKNLTFDKNKTYFEGLKREFSGVCEFIFRNLGAKPFHIRGRLNYAVMDSIMVTAYDAIGSVKDFKDRYSSLLEDKVYFENVTKNTSDEATVRQRFKKAQEYLVE
ncbi:conserved hypothetical protein [Nitrospina gracilis 3/211]|uniref:GmrSD restriction endonucleases N-terminal domain-containing protein n=1 Tax=Nitrospina gracilis (strain 3/211) TaxID=1266370 RepID=M1ZCU4_NITG3|nr:MULTISPECIES: DUF262 domain-containing protein [Nitrospina]MCF8724061.1 uncharacterized protein with ParB-like and HNH nuclease domain [Nitrospina sp. Nb-3]CCQ91193.1 conserved hypothetical protein [Nitrospina gracilis 3/211]